MKRKSVKNDQFEKFKQAARDLETDQSEEAFDRALKKVATVTKRKTKESKDES